MLLEPKDMKPSRGLEDSPLIRVWTPILGVAISALALTAKDLPWWSLAAFAAILFAFASLLVRYPLAAAYRTWQGRRKLRRTAWRFYPDLHQMIGHLQRQLSENYSDSLTSELRGFVNTRDKNGNVVVEPFSDFNRLREWVDLLIQKVARRPVRDFPEIVSAMNLAVTQFWWISYTIQNRVQGVIANALLNETETKKIRQAWNNGREGPNKFFSVWADLSERISSELPEVQTNRHSPLKTLE